MVINDRVIGDFAFRGNISIETIEFGPDVREIGTGAFFQCPNLREVTIPSTVEVVRQGAFASCLKLERLSFDYRTKYEPDAFNGCFGLKFLYNKGVEARVWSLDTSLSYLVTIPDRKLSSRECTVYVGRYAIVDAGFPSCGVDKDLDIMYVAEIHRDGRDYAWFSPDVNIAIMGAEIKASGKPFGDYFGIKVDRDTIVTGNQFLLLIGSCPVGIELWNLILRTIGVDPSKGYSLGFILQVLGNHVPTVSDRVNAMIANSDRAFNFLDMKDLMLYSKARDEVMGWYRSYVSQGKENKR